MPSVLDGDDGSKWVAGEIALTESSIRERTAEVAQTLAVGVARDEAVHDIQVYAGIAAPFNFNGLVRHYFLRRGPTVADVQVNLVPKDERADQSHAVALRVRPVVDSIARAFGASVKVAEIPPGPPVQATLVAEVYGPTYESQIDAARRVRGVFESTDGVVDVDWSVDAPHAQIRASVRQPETVRAGTDAGDVARTIAASMGGAQAGLLHDPHAAERAYRDVCRGFLDMQSPFMAACACLDLVAEAGSNQLLMKLTLASTAGLTDCAPWMKALLMRFTSGTGTPPTMPMTLDSVRPPASMPAR